MSTSAFPGFEELFRELHQGWAPFAWQRDLAEQVLADGWPDVIDVPTGLGKTAVIDLAVYALARQLATGDGERARTRLFLVVDRRVIVDAAYGHALALAQRLGTPGGPACTAVASALRRRAGDAAPSLAVVRMRGGVTWGWRWLRQPDQPAVVACTVDQFGSRLLFRGYGVGARLRPIDAALTGSDALVILDEAHLARPLQQTLESVQRYEHVASESPLPHRGVKTVTMSATPRPGGTVFRADVAREMGDEEAGRRLGTSKLAKLVELAWLSRRQRDRAAQREQLAEALAALARRRLDDDPDVRTMAVVVNTVGTARRVYELLRGSSAAVVLLVGRCREVDRDLLLERWLPRLKAGRDRDGGDRVVVVATQTIEVGADLDFDTLLTEAAPLDAIVQRFGRVARRGLPEETSSVVVHAAGVHDDDPYLYGDATGRTWQWLLGKAGVAASSLTRAADAAKALPEGGAVIDLGPWQVSEWAESGIPEDLVTRPAMAPVVLGPTLDAWARTEPAPLPDQPVAPYLHGLERGAPVVTVCWRADLPESVDDWGTRLDDLPPVSAESVEVPLWQARAYLGGKVDDEALIDQEGAASSDEAVSVTRDAVGYGGRGEVRAVQQPADVKPGDLLVVRAGDPGHDSYGWSGARPGVTTVDVADLAVRHVATLRLDRSVLRLIVALDEDCEQAMSEVGSAIRSEDPPELAPLVAKALEALSDAAARQPESIYASLLLARIKHLRNLDAWDVAERVPRGLAPGSGLVIPRDGGPLLLARPRDEPNTGEPVFARVVEQDDSDDVSSSQSGWAVPLDQHSLAVGRRADEIARRLGLAGTLRRTLHLAGCTHDLGKADRRFQTLLHAGDPLAAEATERPLAKSGVPYMRQGGYLRVLRAAGWPKGMRHEGISAALVKQLIDSGRLGDDVDPELLIHLVATHHGWARPLSKPVLDPAPRTVQARVPGVETVVEASSDACLMDLEGPERFASLCRRYGRWGLALLETVLRLADIACSEEGT